MKTSITIEVDTDSLRSVEDGYLAQLWHIAQANPAPHGDPDAGELASAIGFEIIRRWLQCSHPELYRHQQNDSNRKALVDLGARFIDGRWQISTGDGEVRP